MYVLEIGMSVQHPKSGMYYRVTKTFASVGKVLLCNPGNRPYEAELTCHAKEDNPQPPKPFWGRPKAVRWKSLKDIGPKVTLPDA